MTDTSLSPVPESLITTTVPQQTLRSYGGLALLSKADTPRKPVCIAGYASPQVVDREKHLITRDALARDLPRFMANPKYRNLNFSHSNITCGEIIPSWTNPETGEKYVTKVDEVGLFVVAQLRNDKFRPAIVDKIIEDIEAGKIASFSISADAPYESRRHECEAGTCFWVIDNIEMYEITVCFPGDEPIWTKQGLKPIKDVVVGDEVFTHLNRWRPVTQVMQRQVSEPLYRVTTEAGSIRATAEHPFLVRVGIDDDSYVEWRPARRLFAGDHLFRTLPGEEPAAPQEVRVLAVETEAFEGTVYNLEVADDHSYTMREAVVHNCENPVNQDARFTILTKSMPIPGAEYLSSAFCHDGVCPVTPRQASSLLKASLDAEADSALTPRTGVVRQEFGRRRSNGHGIGERPQKQVIPVDPERPRALPGQTTTHGAILYQSQDDIIRAGTDSRDHRGAVHPGVQAMADKSIGRMPVRKAGYNEPNSPDDEVQYLNKADGQAVSSGTVVEGTDNPTPKRVFAPVRQPALQRPTSGSPAIMKSVARLLIDAERSLGSEQARHLSSQLNRGAAVEVAWDGSNWRLDGLALSPYLANVRKAAASTGRRHLATDCALLKTRLDRALPLDGITASLVAAHLVERAIGAAPELSPYFSRINKASPQTALQSVHRTLGQALSDPANRKKASDHLLAALDSIYADAGHALDGLSMGRTIGLSDDGSAAPGVESGIIDQVDAPHTLKDVARADALLDRLGKANLSRAEVPATKEADWHVITEPDEDIPAVKLLKKAETPATDEGDWHVVTRPDRDVPATELLEKANAGADVLKAPEHHGAMIAYYPTSGTAQQLSLDDGEAPDALHCTIVHLTDDVSTLSPEHRKAIGKILRDATGEQPPLDGTIGGVARFSAGQDEKTPLVALLDVPGLSEFRARIVAALDAAKIPYSKNHGFTPHMTLRYDPPGMDDLDRRVKIRETTPITIDRLHLVWDGQRDEFSLDRGVGQVSGETPETYRHKLKVTDDDAVDVGATLNRMFTQSVRDPRFSLVVLRKGSDGTTTILDLDGE